jgi:pimeloyl-ACP methyl ester carboxylesterase
MIKKILLGILSLFTIALFAWGYAPDITVAELKTKYANAESEFVDVGGGMTVHLRDEGPADAPAIILLHGSNASLHTWDGWTAALKDKYRIIRYDQAGHGLTGPHSSDCYTAACFVDVVDKVAANRGLTKFTLAGNSMGGWVSYEYAKAHPDRLTQLILVDPSGAPEAKPADLPIGFKIARMPGINKLISIITPRSMIEKSLRQTVSNQAIVTKEEVDEYWELLRRPGNREATIKRFAARTGMTPSKPIANSSIPTLILWGKDDKLINVGAAPWFAKQFPDNQVIIYEGVGHLPMEEITDKSASDVAEWLANQR